MVCIVLFTFSLITDLLLTQSSSFIQNVGVNTVERQENIYSKLLVKSTKIKGTEWQMGSESEKETLWYSIPVHWLLHTVFVGLPEKNVII